MDTQTLLLLESITPTFLAIISLVLYTAKTRVFSYAIILLAIGAELVPFTVNMTALLACVSCFIGLLLKKYLTTHSLEKPLFHK